MNNVAMQPVARYAKAFDAQVTVWARASTLTAAKSDGLLVTADLDSLFRENDIVSVHLKLVSETRSIIKLDHLRSMPLGSLFVNTSMAEIVEASALLLAI